MLMQRPARPPPLFNVIGANLVIVKEMDVRRSTWSARLVAETEAGVLNRALCRSIRRSATFSFVKEAILTTRNCWLACPLFPRVQRWRFSVEI